MRSCSGNIPDHLRTKIGRTLNSYVQLSRVGFRALPPPPSPRGSSFFFLASLVLFTMSVMPRRLCYSSSTGTRYFIVPGTYRFCLKPQYLRRLHQKFAGSLRERLQFPVRSGHDRTSRHYGRKCKNRSVYVLIHTISLYFRPGWHVLLARVQESSFFRESASFVGRNVQTACSMYSYTFSGLDILLINLSKPG